MIFVLDASITIAWALRDDDPGAQMAREWARTGEAVVPTLWWFQIRNALVVNERRGRITERQTARFLRQLSRLAVIIDRTPAESDMLTLARRHRLTVYDAADLELALRTAAPLATLDAELAKAAQAEAVRLINY